MNESIEMKQPDLSAGSSRFAMGGASLQAMAFLSLTALVVLVLSHYSLMWYDEFLVLWTDRVPTIGQLLHIQIACPISLHPFGYHAIVHAAIRAFGAGQFAIRLPSLLGFLTMQWCIFIFVRRAAGEREAIVAMALPALNTTLIYAAEGRPYALLLGWFALAMVSWQTAIRRSSHRVVALVCLALAVALAINTHYFGMLVLAPIGGAELYRSLKSRRLDVPVVAAIGAGMAGILFTLPFLKAVGEFHTHYYTSDWGKPDQILDTYLSILPGFGYTQRHEGLGAIAVGLAALILVWGCVRVLRCGATRVTNPEAVLLILLAALPIFGYLLAIVVRTTLEFRFLHGVEVGIAPLIAVAISPLLRRKPAGKLILAALFIAVAGVGIVHIHTRQAAAQRVLSKLRVAPNVKAALMASPTQLLYFEGSYTFSAANYYEPDPEVRSRMALVYSRDVELNSLHADTASLTAEHMRAFTDFTIVPYETLRTQGGEHLFTTIPTQTDDWTRQAFAADHAQVRQLGTFSGGDVVSVRFVP
jgi:hypothetical protein